MDLEPIRSSSSSSGSSSSSSSSACGRVRDNPALPGTPLDAHACISSIADPSISISGHCAKRKLSDVANIDEAQLPQTSVALRGDLSGRSSGSDSNNKDSAASSQTADLRADTDRGCGSANEEKSDGEIENGSVVDSRDSSPSSGNKKKKSKKQKRKAKLQSAEKEAVIAEARGAWFELEKKHKLCMKAADDCEKFDMMKELRMRGETKRDFREGFIEAEKRFNMLHAEVSECGSRVSRIVAAHPSILRAKSGIDEKTPGRHCTFEDVFEIL